MLGVGGGKRGQESGRRGVQLKENGFLILKKHPFFLYLGALMVNIKLIYIFTGRFDVNNEHDENKT